MKLLKYKKITGVICCETGLHIGGASEKMEIGGMDNPIIRNPIDDFPYIPGSSIKGKLRSLLEWRLEKVMDNGEVHKCNDENCPICRIFGTPAKKESQEEKDFEELKAKFSGPTRLIVRDAHLVEEKDFEELKAKFPQWKEKDSKRELQKLKEEKGLPYAEEKWENTINRLTASANPRQMERIPAGIEFKFEMVYRVFDDDNKKTNDENLFATVENGLELLQGDCLGGSGSRGCGKIKIDYKVEDIPLKEK